MASKKTYWIVEYESQLEDLCGSEVHTNEGEAYLAALQEAARIVNEELLSLDLEHDQDGNIDEEGVEGKKLIEDFLVDAKRAGRGGLSVDELKELFGVYEQISSDWGPMESGVNVDIAFGRPRRRSRRDDD